MIEASHLTKQFGRIQALDDVSLKIAPGEVIGLLGPNGSGKTTLMRILTGFFPPSSGTARVAGFDVGRDSIEVRRRVGYLPESTVLYPDMRVRDFLEFCGGSRRLGGRDLRRRIDEILGELSLEDRARQRIGTLSKGFRQRVGLAQALLHHPSVLILDEPTVGLDPRQVIDMRQRIAGLKARTTILLSTHILSEVDLTCDRVVILNGGRIIALDTPGGLARKATDEERMLLRVTHATRDAASWLRTQPGYEVTSSQALGSDVQEVVVRLDDSFLSRQRLASALVAEGFGLLEMRPLTRTLEELFLKLLSPAS